MICVGYENFLFIFLIWRKHFQLKNHPFFFLLFLITSNNQLVSNRFIKAKTKDKTLLVVIKSARQWDCYVKYSVWAVLSQTESKHWTESFSSWNKFLLNQWVSLRKFLNIIPTNAFKIQAHFLSFHFHYEYKHGKPVFMQWTDANEIFCEILFYTMI